MSGMKERENTSHFMRLSDHFSFWRRLFGRKIFIAWGYKLLQNLYIRRVFSVQHVIYLRTNFISSKENSHFNPVRFLLQLEFRNIKP